MVEKQGILRVAVNKSNKYKTYLDIMNGIFDMTEKEKEVVAEFLRIRFEDGVSINLLLTAPVKAIVRTNLGISGEYLHNIIASLKRKNLILKESGTLFLSPKISPTRQILISFNDVENVS